MLTLSNLPPNFAFSVAFDLYVIGSWDGNASRPNGPDFWEVSILGGTTVTNVTPVRLTTFNNHARSAGNTQAWPDDYPFGNNDAGPGITGAFVPESYAIYPVTIITSAPPGGMLKLRFAASNLSSDETWGLKNVAVSIQSSRLPTIITQPQPRLEVREGSAASFVVVADRGTTGYQWWFDQTPISGARSEILTLPAVQISDAGNYSVIMTNCIGSTTSASAVLTVVPNAPPSIATLGDQTIPGNSSPSPIPFTVSDPETPGDNLSVTATSSNTNLVPNTNIRLGGTGNNRTVSLTPALNESGLTTITITATDERGLATTRSFLLTVVAVNDPPTLDRIPDVTINHTNLVRLIDLTGITAGAPNETNQTLAITAVSSDQALIPDPMIDYLSPNPTGKLTITVLPGRGGTSTITVTVSDGGTTNSVVSQTFKVIVPRTPPTVSVVSDQSTKEDTATAPIRFTIGDLQTSAVDLVVSADSTNATLVSKSNIIFTGTNENRTVAITPNRDQFGQTKITITAADLDADTSSISFLLTVDPANDAPTLDPILDQIIDEDAGQQTVNLTGISSGAANEQQELTVTARSSDPSIISIPIVRYSSGQSSATLTFAPATNANGVVTISVVVTDEGGTDNGGIDAVTNSLKVVVAPLNDTPTLAPLNDWSVAQNAPLQVVQLTGISAGAANELEGVTVTAVSNSSNVVSNLKVSYVPPSPSGSLSFTPVTDATGMAQISVSVNDGQGAANSVLTRSFNITVFATNSPPIISNIANQVIDEDTASAPIAFWIGDAENPAADLSLIAKSAQPALLPDSNIVLSGSGTNRTIALKPAPDQFGAAVVTLTVRDPGGLTATNTFSVEVRAVNDPPTVMLSQPLDGAVFTAITNITINAVASDPDGSVARVEFFHETTKLGESTVAPFSHNWNKVPAGNYTLTAKVTDNLGFTATSSAIAISVREAANNPPSVAITSPSDRSTYPPGVGLTITATASDIDGKVDHVEFYAGSSLLGTDATSPYSFTWEKVPVGDYSLTVKAIDNRGGETLTKPVIIAVSEIALGDVAIVQDSLTPEIDTLQEYLFEMGLSSRLLDRRQLTYETLARFQLIIWSQADALRQAVTPQEVEILHRVFGNGVPLYFIGDTLAGASANLSEPQRSQWVELIHLSSSSGGTGNRVVTMNRADAFHPILRGRFGVVEDFAYPTALEGAKESGSGAQALAFSETIDVLVSSPHQDELDRGGTRTVTQNCRVFEGVSPESSRDARKKLFQNAVCWLLQCPGCNAIDLILEAIGASGSVKARNPLVYFLRVVHSGECEGSGIVVTDTLPKSVRFVSAETSHGIWSEAGGIVTFKLGHVPNGSETLMSITVIPSLAGTITNSARLRSYNNEVSLENNASSHVNVVEGSSFPIFEITRSANDGLLQLQVSDALNRRYAIEVSTDLVNWTGWTNFVSAAAVTKFVEPDVPKAGHRFYRLVGQ